MGLTLDFAANGFVSFVFVSAWCLELGHVSIECILGEYIILKKAFGFFLYTIDFGYIVPVVFSLRN
jgi:hypothetical protein